MHFINQRGEIFGNLKLTKYFQNRGMDLQCLKILLRHKPLILLLES
jgi:hypothetical protein